SWRSERRADRELNRGHTLERPAFPGPQAPREVEAQRPERQHQAWPEADHVAHVAGVERLVADFRTELLDLDVRRTQPDVPAIGVDLEPEGAGQRDAQLDRGLDQREPARGRNRALVV